MCLGGSAFRKENEEVDDDRVVNNFISNTQAAGSYAILASGFSGARSDFIAVGGVVECGDDA